MKLCIYGSASNNIDPRFLEEGEKLGAALAKAGHGMVYGGGANGMMGAAARGMTSENGEIIGVAPRFFLVDGVLYDKCTEFIYTDTMRERKQIMEEKSDAFIVTPGGIGTFDEFFEIFSLRQLKRHTKKIIIYNILGYFDPMLEMIKKAVEQHFVSPANLNLISVCSTPEEVLEVLSKEDTFDADENDLRSIMANK
ncbi:MAG: TIGR00730 family Rossman fold protein [Oscillospiraceae bacterium]|nr:TIGR00730 family Rossman fold protein [Oscillospiraceae bacterium]